MRECVFFDIETGGVKHWPHTNSKGVFIKCSPIIQIAAAAVDLDHLIGQSGNPIVNEVFEAKIKFDVNHAEDDALEVCHYDPETWEKTGMSSYQAIRQFSAFLDRHKAVKFLSKRTGRPWYAAAGAGHNAHKFDLPMLMAWYGAHDAFLAMDPFVLDTSQMAKAWSILHNKSVGHTGTDLPNLRLETLAEYFGYPFNEGEAHDALNDVIANIRVFNSLRQELAHVTPQ